MTPMEYNLILEMSSKPPKTRFLNLSHSFTLLTSHFQSPNFLLSLAERLLHIYCPFTWKS